MTFGQLTTLPRSTVESAKLMLSGALRGVIGCGIAIVAGGSGAVCVKFISCAGAGKEIVSCSSTRRKILQISFNCFVLFWFS